MKSDHLGEIKQSCNSDSSIQKHIHQDGASRIQIDFIITIITRTQ